MLAVSYRLRLRITLTQCSLCLVAEQRSHWSEHVEAYLGHWTFRVSPALHQRPDNVANIAMSIKSLSTFTLDLRFCFQGLRISLIYLQLLTVE